MQNKKDEMAELRKLFFRYLREWKWFALSVFCCLGLAFVYLKITHPVYQTNANVLIKEDNSQSSRGLSALKSFSFGFPGSMDVEDELYVISSFSIMRQAVRDLKLYTSYVEKKYLIKKTEKYNDRVVDLNIPTHVVDTLQTTLLFKVSVDSDGSVMVKGQNARKHSICKIKDARFPVDVITPYGTFILDKTSCFVDGKPYSYDINVSSMDVAAEYHMNMVEVFLASKKSNVISLSLQGSDISKCKIILNKIIELYNNDALAEKNLVLANTAEFIKNRLAIISQELAVAETQIEQYKKDHKMFDMSLESKALLEQNNDMQPTLIETSTQLLFLDQIEKYLQDDQYQYALLPTAIGINDEGATLAIKEYNTALLQRMKLLRSTSETNPTIINLNDQIAALRASVFQSIQNVKGNLEIVAAELNARNRSFNQRFLSAPTIEKEFIEIKRNQVVKEQLVMFLMEKREENSLTLAVTAPKAKIIDYAYINNDPISPNKLLILIFALIMGGIIPMVYFYLIDLFKVTFESKAELQTLTTVPVLGEICKSDQKGHVVISKETVTPIAELFRAIRNNINFILNKKDEKVLLVTSTRSGEGKSFFSINLAISLSLTNKRVLLIGMDIRNPKISEYMHLDPTQKGITNYLSDDRLSLNDIIMPHAEYSNLNVISAGPIPPNPGELLLENRLDELMSELRKMYDYIIIDSAPVGMVSDSFNLNRISDMTLFVTRANYTERQSISFVESIVLEQQLKKLYLIINDTKINSGAGYGYGYGVKQDKK